MQDSYLSHISICHHKISAANHHGPRGSVGEDHQRRGWDSNPRALADKRFSRPPRYDHFDTSPDFSHSVSLTLAVRKSLYQVFTALSIDFLDFLKKFFNRHCVISVLFEPLTSATCFILSRSPVVVNIFFYIFCIFSPITFQAHSPL